MLLPDFAEAPCLSRLGIASGVPITDETLLMAIAEQSLDVKPAEEPASIALHRIDFRYEPFPIGFASNVISPRFYNRLLDAWPSQDLFAHIPGYGNKYSLSPRHNLDGYRSYISASEPWLLFLQMIQSQAFIEYVLECLRGQNIDLGYNADQLSSRFEFSMLSGEGGNMLPHTDAPQKLITLVIYMARPGEWNPAWGGGTSVLKPKDIRKNYNYLNIYLDFDATECLHTYPFVPNGCVVFIKTFNSYHAVQPLRGPANALRKSLTINIECKHDPHQAYLQQHKPAFRK